MPASTSTTKKAAPKKPTAAELRRREAQAVTPQGQSEYGAGWDGASSLKDIVVPSGAKVEVRRIGLQGLIKEGILESLDTLTAIVESETIPKAEGKAPAVDVKALGEDPQKVEDMLKMLDDICFAVVNRPVLEKKPEADAQGRIIYEPGKFYLDLIDINDKSFIMNYVVGGAADLEAFREGTAEALAGE